MLQYVQLQLKVQVRTKLDVEHNFTADLVVLKIAGLWCSNDKRIPNAWIKEGRRGFCWHSQHLSNHFEIPSYFKLSRRDGRRRHAAYTA